MGIPIFWLKAEAEAGRLPHVNAGGVLLFDLEEVERALREQAKRKGAANE